MGGDQADEQGRAALAARDPSPHPDPPRHDPKGARLSEAAELWAQAAPTFEARPFLANIEELLEDEPTLSGVRILEEITEAGYEGGKTILDDLLRELRPR